MANVKIGNVFQCTVRKLDKPWENPNYSELSFFHNDEQGVDTCIDMRVATWAYKANNFYVNTDADTLIALNDVVDQFFAQYPHYIRVDE